MTKDIRSSWLRIGVAAILIAWSVVVFATEQAGTEQLVLQGIIFVCGFGLLVQGITAVVGARRR